MGNSLFDFSQAILKLNKEKSYDDALKYFKEHKKAFSQQELGNNAYLVSAMITALRHTNNIDKAFKFLELYNVSINDNTKENILSSYGWLLYDRYKSENHLNEKHEAETEIYDDDELADINNDKQVHKSDTAKLIEEYIPLILKYDNAFTYNVLSKLFNVIPKVEKRKVNADWELVNDLCDLIPTSWLQTSCELREVERKGKKVQMEFASDRENWYVYKSKALMKLGLYQKCYDISSAALEAISKFHYSNDVWFARRIALSKLKLGNSETAIVDLHEILKRKREWFIEKELAELYKEKGERSRMHSNLRCKPLTILGILNTRLIYSFLSENS